MRLLRFFKQLEFIFEGGTRGPLRVDKILAAPPPNLSSPSERPIHPRKRDHTLECKARELLRQLGANKLARGIRVEWNPRLKTCAGRADFREKLISLNPLLRDHGPVHADNLFAVPTLECNKHSSLTSVPPISGMANKLECKVHSNSAKHGGSALQRSHRPEPVCGEVDRTLRHELAHLLAQWRVGRRRIPPHGPEWRQACRDLGIADEARCHNLRFTSKTHARRYVYRCPNCKETFPRVRRIRRAIACLACCRKHNRGDFDQRFRLKLCSGGL
jgi:predicted SprT family Zn-dependent metalloprotease